jgi:hypothetical protein
MKSPIVAMLLLALVAAPLASGADETKKKKKAPAEKNAAGESTLVGMMGIKPEGADKDVVGVIVAKDKKNYKVVASGDLAKQIEELRKKGAPLKITGVVTEDTIKASKAEEGPVKKK